jgi:hypothetical protein
MLLSILDMAPRLEKADTERINIDKEIDQGSSNDPSRFGKIDLFSISGHGFFLDRP